MQKLTLYTNPHSRGGMVRWMLEECGADYDTVAVAFGAEIKAPAYRAINPLGKVPALAHGDTVLTETLAIITWLAEHYPDKALIPEAGSDARGGKSSGEQRVQVGVALVEGEGEAAAGEQPGVFAPTGGGVGNGRARESAQGFRQGFAAAAAEVVGEIEGKRRVAVLPVAEVVAFVAPVQIIVAVGVFGSGDAVRVGRRQRRFAEEVEFHGYRGRKCRRIVRFFAGAVKRRGAAVRRWRFSRRRLFRVCIRIRRGNDE